MSNTDVTEEERPVPTSALLRTSSDKGSAPSAEHGTQPEDPADTDPGEDQDDADHNDEQEEDSEKEKPNEDAKKPEPAKSPSVDERVVELLGEMEKFRRAPKPGAPIPTSGLGAVKYSLWEKGLPGSDFVVPPLTGKEATEYRIKQAKEEVLRLELLKLATTVSVMISVLNSKGGAGKTPTACYLATVLMWAIETMIILVDANENDGTTCALMNVNRRDTKSIRWGMKNLQRFGDFDDVTNLLARPPQRGTAVYVMASDLSSNKDFTKEEFIYLLWTLRKKCKALINDCGNGNPHSAVVGAVTAATHLVFPAMAGNVDTFHRVISTMAAQMGLGFKDKVKRGFVVVNAAQPGDTKKSFMEQLADSAKRLKDDDIDKETWKGISIPEGGLDLNFFGIKPERVFVIPYDKYIKDLEPAHAASLHIDTRIAYLELLVAILKQSSPVPDLTSHVEKAEQEREGCQS